MNRILQINKWLKKGRFCLLSLNLILLHKLLKLKVGKRGRGVAGTFVCTKGRGKYRECQILKKMMPFFYIKLDFFCIGSIFKSARRTLPVSAFISTITH